MFEINITEHTIESVLFTLAELTDNYPIKVSCKDNIVTVDTTASNDVIEPMLFLNDLREEEEIRQRSVVNRQFIGLQPYNCRK